MSNSNLSYRIRTDINPSDKFVNIDFTQNFDKLEILSLEINQNNSYRLMNSNTGIVVGRVLANDAFGIPNAKLSIFISYDSEDGIESVLNYRYGSTLDTNEDGVRYNLQPDEVDDACRQNIGTFPSKRFVLDNNDVIEVFDKYYKYTTRTNNSGDYMIYGVPTGQQTIHCDIDLSDIGILSQTPRDMMYKGFNIKSFESPSKFKKSTNITSLPQIIMQDQPLFVYPFWGDTTDNPTGAAVTRCDVNISYKFEPTCVFLGSVITDSGNNALSKKCVPSKLGGKMAEMKTGSGTIEMIRKTVNGDIEQFSVQGNEVIDDNGIWCYQIPMNLDYIMTDEYGNTVLSDNPKKGIPTRASVRFRISMHENPADGTARKRAKYLVPNNPKLINEDYPKFNENYEVDYEFGSKTKDENFRDIMWNNVYTVKNYIPRIQKARLPNNLRFLGIKMTNHPGSNNPMPYNKLSIKFNFMYTFMCVLIKVFINVVRRVNKMIYSLNMTMLNIAHSMIGISNRWFWSEKLTFLAGIGDKTPDKVSSITSFNWVFPNSEFYDRKMYYGCTQVTRITTDKLKDGSSDEQSNANGAAWCCVAYFLKRCCDVTQNGVNKWELSKVVSNANIRGVSAYCCALVNAIGMGITLEGLCDDEDGNSIDVTPCPPINKCDFLKLILPNKKTIPCYDVDTDVSKLYNCIENQLAQENEVTSFNFFNDWVNGVLYYPLWYRKIKPKKKFLNINIKAKDQWCNGNEQALGYKKRKLKVYSNDVIKRNINGREVLKPLVDDYQTVNVAASVADNESGLEKMSFNKYNEDNCYGYKCHIYGRSETPINSGVIIERSTMIGQRVQYYKSVYKSDVENELVTLFATDLVLLGSLNTCDIHGIPQFFKILESTTYQMPPDLVTEDYSYKETSNSSTTTNTDENEKELIDESTRITEYTGADWGNLGVDQSNYINGQFEANENIYDNGGLFYGITCFSAFTKPKSIINLERICEIGVSLDESQDILKSQSILSDNNVSEFDDEIYTNLTPDGYISYDDIYNSDYRSMFATLNGNFLRTKINYETGLTEYDLTHQYIDNFDGSLYNIMAGKTTHGTLVVDGIDTHQNANYINNYKLEKMDYDYLRFRFGDYIKKNGKKLYYYQYNKTMTHLLVNTGNKLSTIKYIPVLSTGKIPRYENSFYFYFGLTDGKTAIDKFYSEYYSDCTVNEVFNRAIDISYVANDWCSREGGYIKFDCNLDLPLSLTLKSKNHDDTVYTADEINTNKFFVGFNSSDVTKYQHINLNEGDVIFSDDYNVIIVDGNGVEHKDSVSFYNTNTIEFSLEKYDFNLSNDKLVKKFSLHDEVNVCSVKFSLGLDSITELAYPSISIDLGSEYDSTVPSPGYVKYGTINTIDGTGVRVFTPASPEYSFNIDTNVLTRNGVIINYVEYRKAIYKNENGRVVASTYPVLEANHSSIVTSYERGYSNLEKMDVLSINFYNTVAEYGKGLLERDIHGLIVISDISEDNFRINIRPNNPSELADFVGVTVQKFNGVVTSTGYGYLGKTDNIDNPQLDKYYFGMPYGNVNYVVDVMYLCGDEEPEDSENETRTYVTVNEGSFKMFINGIDYDLISNFRNGWSDTTLNAVISSVFNDENIVGWNDINNIGIQNYDYSVQIEPQVIITPTSDSYTYTITNLDEINGLCAALKQSNSIDGSNIYFKKSPYNWFGEYQIQSSDYRVYTEDDITLLNDSDGREPGSSGYVLTYEGPIVYGCNNINNVIYNRVDLTRQMQGTFRLNAYNSLEIVITYQAKSKPVKYCIVNNLKIIKRSLE